MTSTLIDVGQLVPDVTLTDEIGSDVRLRDLAGKTVVLYFYPKNDTPGCTTQACELRDSWSAFECRDDVVIYGVSPDDGASHQKFRAKYDLPFHLLVDADHQLAEAFGIWKERTNYGKTYMGIERGTVIVGADSKVLTIKRRVKPAEHTDWLKGQLGL
ncbi:MAG: peroxiredoxin [Thermoleophilia bacterium]|nr:peroxiredoxin [Thermoleophilia bacterium]